MSTKRKKKTNMRREASLADHLNAYPVGTINTCRYTREAWQRSYPQEENPDVDIWERYEEVQCPDNLMDAFACLYMQGNLYDVLYDFKIQAIPLDDEYFRWLDGRENTEHERTQYASTWKGPKDPTARLAAENLNESYYFYVLPVIGPTDNSSFSTEISAETRKTVEDYFRKFFPKESSSFSLWVAPYMVKMETIYNEQGRILDQAKAKFRDNTDVTIRKYCSAEMQGDANIAVLFLPVIIREKHTFATSREIEEYIGIADDDTFLPLSIPRVLQLVTVDEDAMREAGMLPIDEAQFAKQLLSEVETNLGMEGCQMISCVIRAESVLEFCEDLYQSIEEVVKECRKDSGSSYPKVIRQGRV